MSFTPDLRHKQSGKLYERRGRDYFGTGVTESQNEANTLKTPVVDENGRQFVVYAENLEPADTETIPAAPNLPLLGAGSPPEGVDWGEAEHRDVDDSMDATDPYADRMLARQQQLMAMAMDLAGEQTFHAGNALLALIDGDLHTARAALDQEIARRYPARITTPEEAPIE